MNSLLFMTSIGKDSSTSPRASARRGVACAHSVPQRDEVAAPSQPRPQLAGGLLPAGPPTRELSRGEPHTLNPSNPIDMLRSDVHPTLCDLTVFGLCSVLAADLVIRALRVVVVVVVVVVVCCRGHRLRLPILLNVFFDLLLVALRLA